MDRAKTARRDAAILADIRRGHPHHEIAARHGVHPSWVSRIARLHGLKRRAGRRRSHRRRCVDAMLADGQTPEAVAATLGVPLWFCRRAAREAAKSAEWRARDVGK